MRCRWNGPTTNIRSGFQRMNPCFEEPIRREAMRIRSSAGSRSYDPAMSSPLDADQMLQDRTQLAVMTGSLRFLTLDLDLRDIDLVGLVAVQ